MSASIAESADRDLLDHLRRVEAAGVSDLEALLGVTRTAVRQRLNRLMAEGLVQRVVEKQPRGRPSHRYSLTAKGERLVGDNYADLVEVLWQEVRAVKDPAVRRGLLKRLASRMALIYADRVGKGALAERMHALCALMEEREVPFEVDESGQLPVLTAVVCPYPDLAEHDRGVCAMERMMISEALGEQVHLTEYRLDGGACCSFAPAAARCASD